MRSSMDRTQGYFAESLQPGIFACLGYPDQALKKSQEALAVAREVAHPLSVAAAQTFFALTHQFRREEQAAQEHAEAAVELCSQQGFPFFLAFGTILIGWALAEQGQTEEGITQVRQGLAAYRATGAELATVRFIALLAEAWGKVGQPEEGLNLLAEALAIVNNNGERDYEAELYRVKGELTLQKSGVRGPASEVAERQKVKGKRQKKLSVVSSQLSVPNTQPLTPSTQAAVEQEAEECFHKALDIARQQQSQIARVTSGDEPRPTAATTSDARFTEHATRITQPAR